MAAFVEFGGLPGEDVIELAARCSHSATRLPIDWIQYANHYVNTIGLAPGQGGVLMRKSLMDRLDLGDSNLLRLGDGTGGVKEIEGMRAAGDPMCIDAGALDPVYLIRLVDARADLVNVISKRGQWRYHPTDTLAAPGTDSVLTFPEVCQLAWEQLPDLGEWPELPDGVPTPDVEVIDRLDTHGYRAVDVLEDLLGAVGCGAFYNPVDNTYGITYFPADRDKAIDVFRTIRKALKYDESPYAPKKFGPIPASVVVLFPAWCGGRYGREPHAMYAAEVLRPGGSLSEAILWAQGAELVDSIAYIQDFTPCRIWANNNVANETLLLERAAQVGRIFYDRFMLDAPQWPIKRTYFGIQDHEDLIPGSSFDLVGWQVGLQGAITFCARSGLTSVCELYDAPALTGLLPSGLVNTSDEPPVLTKTQGGVVKRVGGYMPEQERSLTAVGQTGTFGDPYGAAGAGLGPLYRTASPMRQGEWTSVGTGGRTDQRGRLWRNWEDHAPDDMERPVKVTDAATSITMNGTTVKANPAIVMKQEGAPVDWPTEEDCWLLEMNDNSLIVGNGYMARMGTTNDDDGLFVWATYCCDAANTEPGNGDGGGGTPPPGGTPIQTNCCGKPLPRTFSVTLVGHGATCGCMSGTYSVPFASYTSGPPPTWHWTATFNLCGVLLTISLSCTDGVFSAAVSGLPDCGALTVPFGPPTFTCDPFFWELDGYSFGGGACCTGTFDIIATE